MLVEHRPEVLLVCHSGVSAETLITILKCAGYSITYAETKTEAVNWMLRRRFRAVILDCWVDEREECQTKANLLAIPVITITTHHPSYTSSCIPVSVREVLATLFAIAPLEWFEQRPKNIAC